MQGQGQGGKRASGDVPLGGQPALLLLGPVALLVRCPTGTALAVAQCTVLRRVVQRVGQSAVSTVTADSLTVNELVEPKTEVRGQALHLVQVGGAFQWHGDTQASAPSVAAFGRFVQPLCPTAFPLATSGDASAAPASRPFVGLFFEAAGLQSVYDQLVQAHADSNESVKCEVSGNGATLPYIGNDGKPRFLTPPESQRQGAAGDDLAAEAATSALVHCRVPGCCKSMKVRDRNTVAHACMYALPRIAIAAVAQQ